MQGMPTSEPFEADVEMPLAHLLDHLQDKSRKQDFKLYLAQKGIAEVLPGLEQQVGPVPFPIANSRLQKSSIWLGPAGGPAFHCLQAPCLVYQDTAGDRWKHPGQACMLVCGSRRCHAGSTVADLSCQACSQPALQRTPCIV